MKYRILKEISLLTIAQAGPKDCEEFRGEYASLVMEMSLANKIGIFYSPGTKFNETRQWFLNWAEGIPNRINWLIDKGFIERVEPELKPCPFHPGNNLLVVDEDDTGFFIRCKYCSARGPHTPSKRYSIADWNRRP